MFRLAILAAAAAALTATPAMAEIRVCETTLRGPAGEHTIRVEVEDGRIIYGDAVWAPPRQGARANVEFPRLELNYGITDFETGALTPLRYVTVLHAVRMTRTTADTAEVTLAPYTQPGAVRDWPFFARARNAEDTRYRNSERIGGSVHFMTPEALQIAQTAPQIETSVVNNLNEQMANGVFLMVHRVAADALFDRAFQDLSDELANPSRCRLLRHDEWSRAQGVTQESMAIY